MRMRSFSGDESIIFWVAEMNDDNPDENRGDMYK